MRMKKSMMTERKTAKSTQATSGLIAPLLAVVLAMTADGPPCGPCGSKKIPGENKTGVVNRFHQQYLYTRINCESICPVFPCPLYCSENVKPHTCSIFDNPSALLLTPQLLSVLPLLHKDEQVLKYLVNFVLRCQTKKETIL